MKKKNEMSPPVSEPVDPAAPLLPDGAPAFFLDVDGTLIEIAERPDQVRVEAEVPGILTDLHRAVDGALALVSGRSVADLDRLFAPLRLPAGGQHGLEMRGADGQVRRLYADLPELAATEAALRARLAPLGGLLIEPKGMTVALHYRQAPEREGEARRAVQEVVSRYGDRFHVQEGKMVLEIKPRGASKGTVVEQFLATPAFAGRRPVFIGDDITDEDGFAAANRLGGTSILVGHRSPTAARSRIGSVAALRGWLAVLPAALAPRSAVTRQSKIGSG